VEEASFFFLINAGKAMPPKGKLGHSIKGRKRAVYIESLDTIFNKKSVKKSEITGSRKKTSKFVYALNFRVKGKKQAKYFWQKSETKKHMKIETRGLAKAQFWAAMEKLGRSKPGRAYVTEKAMRIASSLTNVRREKWLLTPSVIIESTIKEASKMRPIAIKIGIAKAESITKAWARRLEKEQSMAFR